MNILEKVKAAFNRKVQPEHLERGQIGELAAKDFLQKKGMKFLVANFRSERGEIDLIFREPAKKGVLEMFSGNGTDCLVFVEVKSRSSEGWSRPASAVNMRKKRLLSQAALDYLRRLKNPELKFRFDIVEVLLSEGSVREIRHLPNAFPLCKPRRYA